MIPEGASFVALVALKSKAVASDHPEKLSAQRRTPCPQQLPAQRLMSVPALSELGSHNPGRTPVGTPLTDVTKMA